jgi:hypothetical protein
MPSTDAHDVAVEMRTLPVADYKELLAQERSTSATRMSPNAAPSADMGPPVEGRPDHSDSLHAGSLATAQFGTALAPVYVAREQEDINVFADETVLLQGSRSDRWNCCRKESRDADLRQHGCACHAGRKDRRRPRGADRIAANGDAANKIGTYSSPLMRSITRFPSMSLRPTTSFDLSLASGEAIPSSIAIPAK